MHIYLGVSGEGCGLLTGGELLHAGDFFANPATAESAYRISYL